MVDLSQPLTDLVCRGEDSQPLSRWTNEMNRAFPPLTMVLNESGFDARFRAVGAPDFRLSDMTVSPHEIVRAPGLAGDGGSEFYKVTLQLAGRGIMNQGGRELELVPGTIAVWDTGRAYQLRLDDDFRFLVAMFPKEAVDLPPGVVGELTAMAVSSETGIGSVVAAYLRALGDDLERLQGPTGNRLARTGLDLLGTLFATELDLTAPGAAGSRRTLLTEICHYINANLGDPDLSVSRVAATFFVSARHVQHLFESSGVGAAHWIKRRRLEESRRDLRDPLLASDSISEIAARWGQPDSAYFSRVFKETFGQTPSAWRRGQRAETY